MVETDVEVDNASLKESFSTNLASLGSRKFATKFEAKEAVVYSKNDTQNKKKLVSNKIKQNARRNRKNA